MLKVSISQAYKKASRCESDAYAHFEHNDYMGLT